MHRARTADGFIAAEPNTGNAHRREKDWVRHHEISGRGALNHEATLGTRFAGRVHMPFPTSASTVRRPDKMQKIREPHGLRILALQDGLEPTTP